ncbi:MAG: hypothetical protein HOH43_05235 [Candidatus Latescibacteria bacterium]|jgi:hypothetical protein|nr:hypothetical protein [Candidatus Latescibacterota bacterium]
MQELLNKVQIFHKMFGGHIENHYRAGISESLTIMRARLLVEEVDGYTGPSAYPIDVDYALTDTLYLFLGTNISHGMQTTRSINSMRFILAI